MICPNLWSNMTELYDRIVIGYHTVEVSPMISWSVLPKIYEHPPDNSE